MEALDRKKGKVTQSNALARSRQHLSLMQKRLTYILFANINRDDINLLEQRIPAAVLKQWLGANYGSFYEDVKEAVADIVGQRLEIETENGGWKVLSWLVTAEYVRPKKGADFFRFRLHDDLKPHLLQLQKNFNTLPLDQVLDIPSVNSFRILEILHHDSFAGHRSPLVYELEDLKYRMGLEGKYQRFKDFARVLDKAKEDIERCTLLAFTYEGVREGRTWKQVCFHIQIKKGLPGLGKGRPEEPDLSDRQNLERLQLAELLHHAGFTQNIEKTLDAYDADYIRATVKLAREQERKAATTRNPIRNLGGLVSYMLKAGSARKIEASQKASHGTLAETEILRIAETLASTFSFAQGGHSRDTWQQIAPDERDELHDIMRIELEELTLKILDKQNWQGPTYESARNTILLRQRPELYPTHLLDIDAFVEHEGLLVEYEEVSRNRILEQTKRLL